MKGFDAWLDYHLRILFADFIYVLALTLALILAAIFHRNSKIGKYFLLYLSIDLLLYFVNEYILYFTTLSGTSAAKIVWATNGVVALIELTVYLTFFKNILNQRKAPVLLTCLQFFFILIMMVFIANLIGVIKLGTTKKVSHYVTTTEFLVVIVPCLMYYGNLLSEYSKEFLSSRPSFWIVTGIFQFSILSIPFYSVNYFMSYSSIEYYFELTAVLFYLPLTLNYLLLSKAFLCRKPLTI